MLCFQLETMCGGRELHPLYANNHGFCNSLSTIMLPEKLMQFFSFNVANKQNNCTEWLKKKIKIFSKDCTKHVRSFSSFQESVFCLRKSNFDTTLLKKIWPDRETLKWFCKQYTDVNDENQQRSVRVGILLYFYLSL